MSEFISAPIDVAPFHDFGVRRRCIPLELRDANEFIAQYHRHHKPVIGHRFSIGLINKGTLIGAVIVGRPVARNTDYRKIAEVTRLVTDGTKNSCSTLYSAAARAAQSIGFDSIQTFILDSEPGTSLIASGWEFVGVTTGGDGWDSRPGRRNDQPRTPKRKYVRRLR